MISPLKSEGGNLSSISFGEKNEPKISISAATAFSFSPEKSMQPLKRNMSKSGFTLLQSLQRNNVDTTSAANDLFKSLNDNKEQEEYLEKQMSPINK